MFRRSPIATALVLAVVLAACAAAPAFAAAPAAPKASATEARPVDLNTADSSALE